jgi:hypothetical protein
VFAIPAPRDIRSASVDAVRVCQFMEEGVGHRAIRRFTALSRWHYDPNTYPGNPLIRHEASGLTFRIEQDSDFQIYVRRIFLRTDPADLTEARHLLIGATARRVAAERWPYNQSMIFYMQYSAAPSSRWRAHDPNQILNEFAPPMEIDLA